jgi:hypothetical protein
MFLSDHLVRWGLLFCLIFVQPVPARGQAPQERPVARAMKLTQAPVLDGEVASDPVWMAIPPLTDVWQTAPDPCDTNRGMAVSGASISSDTIRRRKKTPYWGALPIQCLIDDLSVASQPADRSFIVKISRMLDVLNEEEGRGH